MQGNEKVICQLLDSRHTGGIESHVVELSRGLKQAGWQVIVVFMNNYGHHPMKDKLQAQQIPFSSLDGTAKTLNKYISKMRPQLIHTHGYKAGILGRLVGLFNSIRVVSTFHAGEDTKGKMAFYTSLDRLTAFLSHPIAVSEKILAKLPKKAVHVNNFVSLPLVRTTRKGNVVAFVGRLSEEKGPDLFCELARNNPQLTFHMYGDGPMREALQQTYEKDVTFFGHVDISTYWQQIDLLCMPSRFEGLPMAALEAMAHGIPVLASDAGDLPKLIRNSKQGWIASIDQLSSFSMRLDEWASMNQEKKEIMGHTARSKIETEYSCQAIIPQIEKIYFSTIGG
ncbi:glycosyltransferase family 4 protein [Curvivirga sp.]|uniref:glycosyltransferase family 4 protein n=1 Tax=Curvivirga sp. TaxID=2856848 RepID=UPI003B5CFF2A